MSGEMVTLLLGAQGGDEEAFACLYELTNPILVRYLRIVSDGDPDALALTTWATLLEDLAVSVADEDDDWLELAIGTARQHAIASDLHRSGATAAPTAAPTAASAAPAAPEDSELVAGADTDPVAVAVMAIRACGPAVAEVLAIGAAAGLGRDSIARLTGSGPTDVLALVLEGQTRLTMSLESLVATMRLPGTAAEVSGLRATLTLFAAQASRPRRALALAPATATATALELPGWDSIAPAASSSGLPHADARQAASARWAARGVGVAAWTLAVGGVAAAVAMIGVVPAAVHAIFGNGSDRPVVTAHGPLGSGGSLAHPDGRPSGPNGPAGPKTQPRVSSGQPAPQGSVVLATGTARTTPSSQAVAISLSAPGSRATGSVVVVNAMFADFSTASVPAPPVPSRPSTTPPTLPAPVPSSGSGTTKAAPRTAAPKNVKHTTKSAKAGGKDASAKAPGKDARVKVTKAKAKVAETVHHHHHHHHAKPAKSRG